MAVRAQTKLESAFTLNGFKSTIGELREEVKQIYLADHVPWVIGYSGGKDSTAVLQVVWSALSEIPKKERHKNVHVISTDTLVENPIVAAWVNGSLRTMEQAAEKQDLPIVPHRLTPRVEETFWVNLIGKGYPAPRFKFRWCTERLKIQPSNDFIRNTVKQNGEAVLLLGTRKAESTKRAANMAKHQENAVMDRLTPSSSLHNCLVYTPIEDWTNDDVWFFITQEKNPWGYNNKDLLSMYRGASQDNECPLVVDTGTPSCGSSRFGCWVCTLVEEDKSMKAMIQNDVEKEWMLPLLELRKEFDFSSSDEIHEKERETRDFRRLTGALTVYKDRLVHGPYKQETRAYWLRRVLEVQKWIEENAPKEIGTFELISKDELKEIRRIWIGDKHEIEDLVPFIYKDVMGSSYSDESISVNPTLNRENLSILRQVCEENELHYELVRNLLHIEGSYLSKYLRRGIFNDLEAELKRGFFENEEDALSLAEMRKQVRHGEYVSEEGDLIQGGLRFDTSIQASTIDTGEHE